MSDTPPPASTKNKGKNADKIEEGYAKKAAEARGGEKVSDPSRQLVPLLRPSPARFKR